MAESEARKKRNVRDNLMGRVRKKPAPGQKAVAGGDRPARDRIWPILQSPEIAQALAMQYQFEQSETWPPVEMRRRQMAQLRRLLRHSLATVPYYQSGDYRRVLARLAGATAPTLTPALFRELPLLRRSDIQDNLQDLITRSLPGEHGKMFPVMTSGSTGTPVEIRNTVLTSIFNTATTLRGHFWHGRDGRRKNLDIRGPWPDGPPPPRKWMPFTNSGYSVTVDVDAPISELLQHLLNEDPAYLQTRPAAMLGMAELSLAQGRKPKALLQARIYGETMDPELRDTVRRAWNVEVKENYSATEIGTVAIQCPQSESLHIQAEKIYVEILRQDGSACEPGETGRVVVTPLHNYATPLLRYDIGDYAVVGQGCPCGRTLPVLQQILGRHRNLVSLPNGERRFQSTGWNFISQPEIKRSIKQYKMIQRSLTRMDVYLVASGTVTAAMKTAIVTDLTAGFGHPFDFNLIFVDEIERPVNAKFEMFVSEVDH